MRHGYNLLGDWYLGQQPHNLPQSQKYKLQRKQFILTWANLQLETSHLTNHILPAHQQLWLNHTKESARSNKFWYGGTIQLDILQAKRRDRKEIKRDRLHLQ